MNDPTVTRILERFEEATAALRKLVDRGMQDDDAIPIFERAQRLLRERRIRDEVFGPMALLLTETAYDILLLILVQEGRGRATSVSAASTAGNSASSTGLRWIRTLEQHGLIERSPDHTDSRRVYVRLTMTARELLERYLRALPR